MIVPRLSAPAARAGTSSPMVILHQKTGRGGESPVKGQAAGGLAPVFAIGDEVGALVGFVGERWSNHEHQVAKDVAGLPTFGLFGRLELG